MFPHQFQDLAQRFGVDGGVFRLKQLPAAHFMVADNLNAAIRQKCDFCLLQIPGTGGEKAVNAEHYRELVFRRTHRGDGGKAERCEDSASVHRRFQHGGHVPFRNREGQGNDGFALGKVFPERAGKNAFPAQRVFDIPLDFRIDAACGAIQQFQRNSKRGSRIKTAQHAAVLKRAGNFRSDRFAADGTEIEIGETQRFALRKVFADEQAESAHCFLFIRFEPGNFPGGERIRTEAVDMAFPLRGDAKGFYAPACTVPGKIVVFRNGDAECFFPAFRRKAQFILAAAPERNFGEIEG